MLEISTQRDGDYTGLALAVSNLHPMKLGHKLHPTVNPLK